MFKKKSNYEFKNNNLEIYFDFSIEWPNIYQSNTQSFCSSWEGPVWLPNCAGHGQNDLFKRIGWFFLRMSILVFFKLENLIKKPWIMVMMGFVATHQNCVTIVDFVINHVGVLL